MFLLVLSFIALWCGPLLLMSTRPNHAAMVWIDRIVILCILLLVLFHIIPESIEQAGLVAFAAILLGALWPVIYQRASKSNNCHLQRSLLSLASVGVITHTFLDGVALADDAYIGMAVILHRLPEGMGLWRVAVTTFNRRWGFIALAIIMFSTACGYFFGTAWLAFASEGFVGLFEGLMAGVLLHVVFHKTHVTHSEDEHE
ncbi:MAG: hypothetical protein V4534_00360 [Myxococcota bacterium]